MEHCRLRRSKCLRRLAVDLVAHRWTLGGLYLHSDELVATTDSTSLTFALRTTASDQRVTVSLYGERNQQLAKPRPLSQLGATRQRAAGNSTKSPWPSSLERGQQLAASSSKMARGQRSRSFSWTKSG